MSLGLNAGQNRNTNRYVNLSKNFAELKYCVTTLQNKIVHIKKLTSDKIWECLLSFRPESFVFIFTKYTNQKIQNCNLSCCVTWVSAYFITLKETHWRRVFKNRLLRKAFVSEREEVIGDCRKTHDEELQDLYLSPNNLRVTRWWRLRWAGHVACMGRREIRKRFWWWFLKERDCSKDLAVHGRVILKCTFRK